MSAAGALEPYFREASSWDADRAAQLRRSERRAWQAAAAGWIAAVIAMVTIAVMTPLKTIEPYVVRVDSRSGIVDVVPVYAGNRPLDETVSRYFLTHYVLVCERFNFATAESDYEECGAFHSASRNQAWYARWDRNNPSSPLNIHKDGSTVRVEVESVSFFQRASGLSDLAQVRFRKLELSSAGGQAQVSQWIATIQYAYGPPSKDPRTRRWNPLGFKVLEMHSEPEVAGPGVVASHLAEAAGAADASNRPRRDR